MSSGRLNNVYFVKTEKLIEKLGLNLSFESPFLHKFS